MIVTPPTTRSPYVTRRPAGPPARLVCLVRMWRLVWKTDAVL